MNKKQKKENRKILISIVAIVLLICLLAMGTFSYLTYNSTKEIDKYQAELKANNIIDNANYIDITNFGEVNSFVVGHLHNYSDTDENSTYVILKNDYYNLSVDNANKLYIKTENYYTSLDYFTADSRATYNYGLGNYLDYFTLRNSMTDEQYNKICDYLNTEPDENGNYYNGFDIGWAVDPETREPVHLPGVDFIRVYTALNQYCGWIGETSTEIFMARDMHIYVRPDQHQ